MDQRRSSRARSATTLTARSAKNRSASSSSSVRPAPARPAPRATRTSGRAKVDAVAVSPSGPASRSNSRPASLSGHRPVLDAVGCPAGHLPDQGVRVHAPLGRLGPPAAIQGVRCLVLLGLAGGLDGPLDQPRRPLPTVRGQPVQLGVDLAGALGEPADQRLGHPLELAVAVGVRRRPLHPERPDELALVGGPVDGVRGQPMPVQIAAVQGRPASVRPLDPVGDDQMGVQQRIALPGRPVVEPDRQQPLSGHMLDTTMAAAGPQVLVQVADRLGQPGVMGGQHRPAGGRVTQAVEDRHALGRPQDHVKGRARRCGHGGGPAAPRSSGRGPRTWPGTRPRDASPCSPRLLAPAPYHRPGDSPWPDRYCFVVGGQLAGVVLLPPHRQLGDVGHHPAAPLLAFVGASERTRGALLSSENGLG